MKVSVCMIVYNHEKFIEEAILGVLNQEIDFEIELIISNDNSTDKTHDVIERVLANNPDKKHIVKYYNHTKNNGMMDNFISTLKLCTGEYIAFCEGDDYWNNPLKLINQIRFLDQNLDYNICFHNVMVFNQETKTLEPDTITRDVLATTNVTELSKGNYIHTPSVVIRNNFKLPTWFNKSPLGDWVLYMICINDKKIMKLNDVMAVYRVHGTSVWSNKSNDYKLKQTIKCHQLLMNSKVINAETKKQLSESIKHMKMNIIEKDSWLKKLKTLIFKN